MRLACHLRWIYVLAIAFTPVIAPGSTDVPAGTISTTTTWTLAGSPYVVNGTVHIHGGSSPVLTIEPGVTVQFVAGGSMVVNLYDKGAVHAVGTPSAPITFTSSVGTTAGAWNAIYLGGAAGPPSRFEHVVVENGGSTGLGRGGVHVDGGAPVFENTTFRNNLVAGLSIAAGAPAALNCTFEGNSGAGIYVAGGDPTITNATITSNTGWAVDSPAAAQLNQLTGLTATGNGNGSKNAVFVRPGTISGNRRWFNSGIDYVVGGSIYVHGSTDPTLTIDPGVRIRFVASGELLVNHYDKGAIAAIGTSTAPIVFTSQEVAAAGSWVALYLGGSGPTPSQLKHVVVEHAGRADLGRGGIHVALGSHVFEHVISRDNLVAGLSIGGGSPSVANSAFENNSGFGINLTGGSATINSSTFTGNTDYAIGTEAVLQITGMAGLQATNNGQGSRNATLVRNGTITQSRRWYASSLPYVISGTLYVHGSSDPILSIDPGTTISLKNDASIQVNYYDRGSIVALGSEVAPIRFTAETGVLRGTWVTILLGAAGPTNSRFQWCVVEYAGSNSQGRAAVTVLGREPEFDHVTFRENLQAGLRVHSGSPVIQNCTFTSSSGFGLDVLDAAPHIISSEFRDNGDCPIAVNPNGELRGMTGLSGSNNGPGKDVVYLREGTISSSRTWRKNAFPYVAEGSLYVHGGTNPILTIEAGVTVKFGSRAQLLVNYYSKGAVLALGTPTEKVLFTSNGTTTPGHWLSILLGGAANNVESRFEHVIIEYGGSNSPVRGGVHVEGGSPIFANVTFQNNLTAGLTMSAGAPSITNCEFTSNTDVGLDVVGGILNIASSTFTANANHALRIAANTDIVAASNLVATGQPAGRNAIWVKGGNMANSRTWPSSGLPYVIAGTLQVHAGSSPILTIAAGNTIKLEPSGEFHVNYYAPGALKVLGTSSDPVIFTANNPSPEPASWRSVLIGGASAARSEFEHVVFEYGGESAATRGAVHVGGGEAWFKRVTFRNNAVAGLSISGGTSNVTECSFSNNPSGIRSSGTFTADARRSYWDSADGPSGSGFGTGQSVGTNVKFEPWLTAAPTSAQAFTSADVRNRIFNPAIGTTSGLQFTTASPANWTMTVRNGSSVVLRTYTGSGSPGDVMWDGFDGAGVSQPDGIYTYILATANAAPLAGRMIVDSTKQLTGSVSVEPAFSPNGDGVLDIATVRGSSSFEDTAWSVTIRNAGGIVVRQGTNTGQAFTYVWDGRDDLGALQPDGPYGIDVFRSAGSASLTSVLSTLIDVTVPQAVITTPLAGAILSNVYQQGATDIAVEGSAFDANIRDWRLDYGSGAAPSGWTTLTTGSTSASGGQLGLWQSFNSTNGIYTIRLQVWDQVGNRSEARVTTTLGNFRMSKNVDQFKPSAGQTATYSSIVPFTLDQSIVLKDAAGNVIRTLFDASRTAGTYSDVWDGLNDAGAIVPDGPYFYSAIVSDGTYSMDWDLTDTMRSDGWLFYYPQLSAQFDPFNNKPLAITYTFDRPGRIYVIFSPHNHPTPCVAPAYCWKNLVWQEAGTHTLYWAGIDDSGAVRSDLNRTTVTSWMTSWPQNAVLIYGSKPVLSPVTVTPPFYGPAAGTQSVTFTLSTFQNQPATVTVAFRNQSSGSVLRTLTNTAQLPGQVVLSWDGRSDNGMWVAPGVYIVTVTATDSIGNSVSQQILTNIAY